ncbi:hypothetical protein STAL104432_05005 [Streptomyces albus]
MARAPAGRTQAARTDSEGPRRAAAALPRPGGLHPVGTHVLRLRPSDRVGPGREGRQAGGAAAPAHFRRAGQPRPARGQPPLPEGAPAHLLRRPRPADRAPPPGDRAGPVARPAQGVRSARGGRPQAVVGPAGARHRRVGEPACQGPATGRVHRLPAGPLDHPGPQVRRPARRGQQDALPGGPGRRAPTCAFGRRHRTGGPRERPRAAWCRGAVPAHDLGRDVGVRRAGSAHRSAPARRRAGDHGRRRPRHVGERRRAPGRPHLAEHGDGEADRDEGAAPAAGREFLGRLLVATLGAPPDGDGDQGPGVGLGHLRPHRAGRDAPEGTGCLRAGERPAHHGPRRRPQPLRGGAASG